jgi:bacteriocin biosynthesis cyclodehydratase domain-containing protein
MATRRVPVRPPRCNCGMRSDGCRYLGSKEWSVTHEGGFLIASAGADELYAIEDVPDETAAELAALWARPAYPADLSKGAALLVPQLLNIGALVRDVVPGPPRGVAVIFSGPRDEDLVHAFVAEAAEMRGWSLVEPCEAELTLVARTGGRLVEISDRVSDRLAGPHLLLDVAYNHCISLGPLVFLGETACLACLAGRIGQYWGDPVPPERPAIQRNARLIAGLAALELERAAAGDYSLVNTTVAFDLRRYEVVRHPLYKLPWCPVCGEHDRGQRVGLIPLPWARAA